MAEESKLSKYTYGAFAIHRTIDDCTEFGILDLRLENNLALKYHPDITGLATDLVKYHFKNHSNEEQIKIVNIGLLYMVANTKSKDGFIQRPLKESEMSTLLGYVIHILKSPDLINI